MRWQTEGEDRTVDEDVDGLEIGMDDAVVVQELEAVRKLQREAERLKQGLFAKSRYFVNLAGSARILEPVLDVNAQIPSLRQGSE